MEGSNGISNTEFLNQLQYVRKVVQSCTTLKQLENAKIWANNWVLRVADMNPALVQSKSDLYLLVTDI